MSLVHLVSHSVILLIDTAGGGRGKNVVVK